MKWWDGNVEWKKHLKHTKRLICSGTLSNLKFEHFPNGKPFTEYRLRYVFCAIFERDNTHKLADLIYSSITKNTHASNLFLFWTKVTKSYLNATHICFYLLALFASQVFFVCFFVNNVVWYCLNCVTKHSGSVYLCMCWLCAYDNFLVSFAKRYVFYWE